MSRIRGFMRPHRALFAIALTAALAFPLGVLASHQFTDVPDSNPYHADIDAIADAGVTTGCGGGNYCPTANVTRQEMAAFMNRLGALAPGKTPVVNAKTSQSTDGWSIGCPSGTVLGGGFCFETGARSGQDVFDASETCGALGGTFFGRGQIWQLPPALALRAAHVNGDITISAQEWSSSFYHDDATTYRSMTVNGASTNSATSLTVLPFRCAALPLQIDNNLIIVPLDAPTAADKTPKNKQPAANGAE